jgi:hypothetical protein
MSRHSKEGKLRAFGVNENKDPASFLSIAFIGKFQVSVRGVNF